MGDSDNNFSEMSGEDNIDDLLATLSEAIGEKQDSLPE